jgi:hypothetical protein
MSETIKKVAMEAVFQHISHKFGLDGLDRCDDHILVEFGDGLFVWLFDDHAKFQDWSRCGGKISNGKLVPFRIVRVPYADPDFFSKLDKLLERRDQWNLTHKLPDKH